jgi:hypothetical protein
MDLIATLSIALGSAWVSGINLYATVATLGLLGRFAGLSLPGDLSTLTNPWVIGVAIALYCVEFVADKVPVVDSAWDVVHTFVRVPAAAVLAASAFGDFDPAVRVIALLAGGGLALGSHGTKAGVRALLNMSPEPVTNVVASVTEDVIAVGGILLAIFLPILFLCILAIVVGVTIWLMPKIVRLARRTFETGRRLLVR